MKPARPASESPGPNSGDRPPESRRYARKQIDQPVEFAVDGGERLAGICRNISLGGLHIDAAEPAPFGASITIFIELPGLDETASLPGVVRWTVPGGMGVQLGLFGAQVTHALIRLVSDS
jgi:hypothetical protein